MAKILNSPQLQLRLTSIKDEIELKQQNSNIKLSCLFLGSHHHNRAKV
ncbi:MAG: hypothetical protein V7K41_06940 [Nostoc sp.]